MRKKGKENKESYRRSSQFCYSQQRRVGGKCLASIIWSDPLKHNVHAVFSIIYSTSVFSMHSLWRWAARKKKELSTIQSDHVTDQPEWNEYCVRSFPKAQVWRIVGNSFTQCDRATHYNTVHMLCSLMMAAKTQRPSLIIVLTHWWQLNHGPVLHLHSNREPPTHRIPLQQCNHRALAEENPEPKKAYHAPLLTDDIFFMVPLACTK